MATQRNTVQRQIVLDALQRFETHPSIEEIFAAIHKEHPAISKTTIYRNLRSLARSGDIRQVVLPGGLERYEGRAGMHYHFQCFKCERVYDVDIGVVEGIEQSVRDKYGFQVDGHDMVFTGVCQECLDI